MANEYGALASWVYDVDKPIGRTFGDVEFYLSRLEGFCGPILEPAVGNGRLLIPLIEAGYVVYGFDASSHMLEVCKRELSKRKLVDHTSKQRFEDFCYGEKFSTVVMPAGSIQLIKSYHSCLEFLKRLKSCLSRSGKIIIDIDSLDGMMESTPKTRVWNLGADVLTLTETRVKTNYLHQTVVSQLRYEHWNEGGLVSLELEMFSLRFWSIFEFRSVLHEVGFKDISITLDYKYPFSMRDSGSVSGKVITFEASLP